MIFNKTKNVQLILKTKRKENKNKYHLHRPTVSRLPNVSQLFLLQCQIIICLLIHYTVEMTTARQYRPIIKEHWLLCAAWIPRAYAHVCVYMCLYPLENFAVILMDSQYWIFTKPIFACLRFIYNWASFVDDAAVVTTVAISVFFCCVYFYFFWPVNETSIWFWRAQIIPLLFRVIDCFALLHAN